MSNEAAENLATLMNAGGNQESAQDALDRLAPDPSTQRVPATDEDGDAKFGTPEAIATAIAGSFLLGPVGGLILGGAQGWLKKRADQSVLDALAADNEALSAANAVYDDTFARFKSEATNPDDLTQIAQMESQRNAALKQMKSGIQDTRELGMQSLMEVDTNMNAYAVRQETQRIADEQLQEQLKIELGDRQFSRYTGLQADFDAQSDGYLQRQQAATTALNALESGTPADLHAAIILFNKTLDPNSAVLGEERAAITEMGGWLDKGYNFLHGGFTGEQLNSKQRRELADAIVRISDESTKFQLQREGEFSDRVSDAELPAEFNDNFRLVENVPAAVTPHIDPDLAEQALIQDRIARDNQSMLIGDTADSIKAGAQTVGGKVDQALDNAAEFGGDLKRSAGDRLDQLNEGADTIERLFQQGLRHLTGRPTN